MNPQHSSYVPSKTMLPERSVTYACMVFPCLVDGGNYIAGSVPTIENRGKGNRIKHLAKEIAQGKAPGMHQDRA